jgi:NAD(P)-dependent dehydrogenase (short-subunit alcohol dehydrogenase family)
MVAAHERWGRIDILHYNVGMSISGGDASLLEITEEAFDRIARVNLWTMRKTPPTKVAFAGDFRLAHSPARRFEHDAL